MKKITIITATVLSLVLIGSGFLVYRHFSGDRSHIDSNGSITTGTAPGSNTEDQGNDDSKDYTYIPPTPQTDANGNDSSTNTDTQGEDTPFVPNRELNLDPSTDTFLVNKEYALPKDYVPKNLVIPNVEFDIKYYDERKLMRPEAAGALEDLFAAAKSDGYTLVGVSAYRSYNRQYQIFISNIVSKGKAHTLKYSAVPGTSEHQTGLSIDVTSEDLNNKLVPNFSTTQEGIWLAQNAHRFGYIIRYPEDKVDITGYAYEPWHIRYVGKGLATYLYENNLSLDEYYNYTPSKGFNFEKKYAAIINYKPPTPTPTPVPSPTISIMPSPTVKPTPGAGNEGTGTDTDNQPGKDDTNPGSGTITGTPITGKPSITPGLTPTGSIPQNGNGQNGNSGEVNTDPIPDDTLIN